MSETPEKDKYLKWFNDEKAKGLVVFGQNVKKKLACLGCLW